MTADAEGQRDRSRRRSSPGDPMVLPLIYPSFVHAPDGGRERDLARLAAAVPCGTILDLLDRDSSSLTAGERHQLADAEVALTVGVPAWLVEASPKLKWVQTIGTGTDHLDADFLRGTALRVSSAAGTSADEIAEFVVARILEHWKRLPEIAAAQHQRVWSALSGRSLSGSTVVLVGFGAINAAVARRLAAFGVRLVAVRRSASSDSPGVDEVVPLEDIDGALGRADAVVSALPATPETTGLFDARRFASMRAGVFFCNVGRGSAVIEADLMAALSSGHLGGAALDVVAQEPLPSNDPLWTSTARLSAHCSTVPSVAIQRVHDLFVTNLGRFLRGEPLQNELRFLPER